MRVLLGFVAGLLFSGALYLAFGRPDQRADILGEGIAEIGKREVSVHGIGEAGQEGRRKRMISKGTKEGEAKELESLIAQVAKLGAGEYDRASLRQRLAFAYAEHDPDGGFEWLMSLDQSGPHIKSAMSSFAAKLGAIGSDKWKEYLDQMSKGSVRDELIWGAISGMITLARHVLRLRSHILVPVMTLRLDGAG